MTVNKRSSPLRRLTLGRPLRRPKAPGVMNKLEAAYAKHLTEEGVSWRYERYALILRHGGDGKKGLRYTPDFAVRTRVRIRDSCGDERSIEGPVEFHEVKGFRRAKNIAKLKMAAETFPEHRFFLVEFKAGQWVTQRM